jgi:hypothetical protein
VAFVLLSVWLPAETPQTDNEKKLQVYEKAIADLRKWREQIRTNGLESQSAADWAMVLDAAKTLKILADLGMEGAAKVGKLDPEPTTRALAATLKRSYDIANSAIEAYYARTGLGRTAAITSAAGSTVEAATGSTSLSKAMTTTADAIKGTDNALEGHNASATGKLVEVVGGITDLVGSETAGGYIKDAGKVLSSRADFGEVKTEFSVSRELASSQKQNVAIWSKKIDAAILTLESKRQEIIASQTAAGSSPPSSTTTIVRQTSPTNLPVDHSDVTPSGPAARSFETSANVPQSAKNSAPTSGAYPSIPSVTGLSGAIPQPTGPNLPSGQIPPSPSGSNSSTDQSRQIGINEDAVQTIDSALQKPQIALTPIPENPPTQSPNGQGTGQSAEDADQGTRASLQQGGANAGEDRGKVLDEAFNQSKPPYDPLYSRDGLIQVRPVESTTDPPTLTPAEPGAPQTNAQGAPLGQSTNASTQEHSGGSSNTANNNSPDGVDPIAKALNQITKEDMGANNPYLPDSLIPERPVDSSGSPIGPNQAEQQPSGDFPSQMPPERLIDQGGYSLLADAQPTGSGLDGELTNPPQRLEDGASSSSETTLSAPLNQNQPDVGQLYINTDPATPLELARIAPGASSGSWVRSFFGGLKNFGSGALEFAQSEEGQQFIQTLGTLFPTTSARTTTVPNWYGSICGPGYALNTAKPATGQSYSFDTAKLEAIQKELQQSSSTASSQMPPACNDHSIVGDFKCIDEILKDMATESAQAQKENKQLDDELAKLRNAQTTPTNPNGSFTSLCVPVKPRK